ncbi:MAG: hypothetical protein OXH04_05050 [Acidobacteria bacterium]|nr:hypothetical protein [Acidobacteriota bacterium]
MLGELGIAPGALLLLGGLGALLAWLLSGQPRGRAALRARKRG